MRGMNRVFQGASTVDAILRSDLIERAAEAGMRSVFVGLETVNPANLALHAKRQNVARDYAEVIRKVHGLGLMINASFVFGLDDDGPDVFDRTVEWGISQGIETATFHIMTPYRARPCTPGRGGPHHRPRLGAHDTRHVVYRPPRMTRTSCCRLPAAYHDFYRWAPSSEGRGRPTVPVDAPRLGGRSEPLWDVVIRAKRVNAMLPLLEDARRVRAGPAALAGAPQPWPPPPPRPTGTPPTSYRRLRDAGRISASEAEPGPASGRTHDAHRGAASCGSSPCGAAHRRA
jgi:hypothetical protein